MVVSRFPCSRWLGRNVDDGSTERLLIAELVPVVDTGDYTGTPIQTPPRCRSPSVTPRINPNDIQQMLSKLNNIFWH